MEQEIESRKDLFESKLAYFKEKRRERKDEKELKKLFKNSFIFIMFCCLLAIAFPL